MAAAPAVLDQSELVDQLGGLHNDWEVASGKLHRELRFGDFVTAFGFMASVAIVAERRNHHPEWSNVYNRVTIDLVTHDAGGITANDIDLAAEIDRLAGE